MKKKEEIITIGTVVYCDICGKKIEEGQQYWAEKAERTNIIKGIIKQETFDEHTSCINSVVRETFKKYIKK